MTLGDLLTLGGWPMVPIYACSVVALAVFLRKLIELRGASRGHLAWVDEVVSLVSEDDVVGAEAACAKTDHPAARAVGAALRVAERRPDRASAEAARVGSLEIQSAEKHLSLLSFIAQVAPLLGLLGTVVGMVHLFIDMDTGSGFGGTKAMSSGIWKALLTTAAGLIVAVPTLAAHSYLVSRSDALRLLLHDVIQRVLTAAPADSTLARASAEEPSDAV